MAIMNSRRNNCPEFELGLRELRQLCSLSAAEVLAIVDRGLVGSADRER